MQVVIVAGGKGTRLRSRIGDLPKPLAPVGGYTLLEHHIQLAKRHGIRDIVLLTGYRAGDIREFCGDGSRWDVSIRYHEEKTPLGTAGCVLEALPLLEEEFIVLYGDVMTAVDLRRFAACHKLNQADVTLFTHPNDHPYDSDLVEVDEADRVTAFHPYPHPEGVWYRNLVNAAAYVITRRAIEPYRHRFERGDFAKGLFPLMLENGANIYSYTSAEYINRRVF